MRYLFPCILLASVVSNASARSAPRPRRNSGNSGEIVAVKEEGDVVEEGSKEEDKMEDKVKCTSSSTDTFVSTFSSVNTGPENAGLGCTKRDGHERESNSSRERLTSSINEGDRNPLLAESELSADENENESCGGEEKDVEAGDDNTIITNQNDGDQAEATVAAKQANKQKREINPNFKDVHETGKW